MVGDEECGTEGGIVGVGMKEGREEIEKVDERHKGRYARKTLLHPGTNEE